MTPLPPIVSSIRVSWTPDEAFHRFTARIGDWWPLRSHSVGTDSAESAVMTPSVGGEIVERIRGGAEAHWGTVLAWEPPTRVAFTWHPGRVPSSATRVEVRFTPDGTGTHVELVHSGWEALGTLARTARRGYPIGWAYMLRVFAHQRSSPVVIGIDILQWLARPLTRRMASTAGPMVTRPAQASTPRNHSTTNVP